MTLLIYIQSGESTVNRKISRLRGRSERVKGVDLGYEKVRYNDQAKEGPREG